MTHKQANQWKSWPNSCYKRNGITWLELGKLRLNSDINKHAKDSGEESAFSLK